MAADTEVFDDVQAASAQDTEFNSDDAAESQSPEPVDVTPDVADDAPAAGISEALIGRAEGYGLSQVDLEGLDEPRLERMFSAIDRRIMQPVQPGQPPAVPAAAPGQPAPTGVPMGTAQYAPLTLELGDELDESFAKPFQTVVDHMNGQMRELHAFRQRANAELQAMNVLRELSDFDRFVSGLGEEWTSDYGAGTTADMNTQSGEFQKRLEVFHGAKALRADALRRGQQMGVLDALNRSHCAVHGNRIAEHERKKLGGKIDRRRKGFTERVTPGKAPAMSPRDEAIAAFR